APAQRDELRGRMHELADRAPGHAAEADAEQRLGRGVHLRDQQRLVEHDDRRGETLEYLTGRGRGSRSAQSADGLGGRRRARDGRGRGGYGRGRGSGVGRGGCGFTGELLLGFWTLDCWTMKVVASERITSAPL